MAMFIREANQFSPLFIEKNYMLVSKKHRNTTKKNTKMMYRYSFSLNNMCN